MDCIVRNAYTMVHVAMKEKSLAANRVEVLVTLEMLDGLSPLLEPVSTVHRVHPRKKSLVAVFDGSVVLQDPRVLKLKPDGL